LALHSVGKFQQCGIDEYFVVEMNSSTFLLEKCDCFAVCQSGHISIVFPIDLFLYILVMKGLQIVNCYNQIQRRLPLKCKSCIKNLHSSERNVCICLRNHQTSRI